jgi:hypothetical protein
VKGAGFDFSGQHQKKGGITDVANTGQTFYLLKKHFVGLETDHIRPMKQLREENGKLKQ